ncbi:ArsR/SmtB family transcription factor [Streptomyces sp. MMG1533]|uniref:ArsR/SmtB family transcription factor n=1 Tax=Streptomyces sp. MMG1533 TaxID=1415546 RepID=UPI000A79A2E8|nr:metalloregulator ArsR/SmtB family transcription factor [Streptomyces sp. MMG1533]
MIDHSHESDLVFRALNDATRRAILALLASEHEPTAGDIAAAFPAIGRTAVSAHLRVLRDAQLVSEIRDGKHRRYRLGPNRADTAIAFLRQIYEQSLPTDQGVAADRPEGGPREAKSG